MSKKDLYSRGHLVVAAIRILDHRDGQPPGIEAVSGLLSLSVEQVHLLVSRLAETGVIDMEKGPFGLRLFIKNHLWLEDLPREETGPNLRDEVEKFKTTQKGLQKKIEDFQAKKALEKKELFAKIEEKLKKGAS